MALVAKDVVCGYGAGAVVKGAGFSLEPGRTVAVLGPNGVGKTTLFKAVLGFLPVSSGTLIVDGRSMAALTRNEVARAVAYVPQSQSVPFSYTVEEFVLMGRAPHLKLLRQPRPEDRSIARQALEEMGIAHLGKKTCTEVSGGEMQLACIARALAQRPRYLVMDEPTASLDFGNQARVLRRVLDLAAGGIGVLMTTHDPAQALALGSDVLLLQRGGACRWGPCNEVLTDEVLTAAYGVDVLVGRLERAGRCAACCAAVV